MSLQVQRLVIQVFLNCIYLSNPQDSGNGEGLILSALLNPPSVVYLCTVRNGFAKSGHPFRECQQLRIQETAVLDCIPNTACHVPKLLILYFQLVILTQAKMHFIAMLLYSIKKGRFILNICFNWYKLMNQQDLHLMPSTELHLPLHLLIYLFCHYLVYIAFSLIKQSYLH